MAIDTRLKRQSAACMLVPSMVSGVYADGAGLTQAKRQAAAWSYSGILAGSAITITITNPAPADASTTDSAFLVFLSVDVTESGGLPMDVSFYDASDDSLIDTVARVPSGSTATVVWEGLSRDTEYEWYVEATNGSTEESDTWSFTTNDTNETYLSWDSTNEVLKTFIDGFGVADSYSSKFDLNNSLSIINNVPNNTALSVKGAENQFGRMIRATDDSGNVLFEVTESGHTNNLDGFRTVTPEYGAGLGVQLYGENAPEHFNQYGWYDHTGGAYENLLTRTSGDSFTQADADNANWIVFVDGTYPGAMCEIKEYINSTSVIVDGLGWDQDLNTSTYPGNFIVVKHPGFVSGDGNKHEFSVGATGEFEIISYDFTGACMAEIELDSAADGTDGVRFKAEANGYSNVEPVVVDYIAGDLGAGERGGCIGARLDVSGATSADSTTQITVFTAVIVNGSDATATAFDVLPGFTNALRVAGADAEDPGYGYDVDDSTSTVTDRVNGVAPAGTAFLDSSATDVILFAEDDDYMLIGSDNTFEAVEVTLTTVSSKDIEAVFEYSTGSGTWSTLTLSIDGTRGFQQSGLITFSAPGGWAKGDQAEAPADITSAYYIRIARTYSPALVAPPVEAHFKIYEDKDLGMVIRGDGSVQPVTAADADMPNDSIYNSIDQGVLVYKDIGGTVNDLY